MGSNVVFAPRFALRGASASPSGCHGSLSCELVGALPEVAVVAGFLGVLVGVAVVLHLSDAESVVERERVETVLERHAFESFAERVAGLDASSPTPVPAGATTALSANRGDAGVGAVTDAYRETVLALDHYEDEYGEPLAQNMAAELGADVTRALVDREEFTPPVKTTLVARADAAARKRTNFAATLDAEAEALADADATFRGAIETVAAHDEVPLSERDRDDLDATWRRIRHLETAVAATLDDRQTQIRETAVDGRQGDAEATVLPEYLYRDLDVTFPVLADGVAVLDDLRRARQRAFHALAYR